MEGTGLSLGEAMALTNKNDDFDGGWLMWIIALAIVFGNGGFGFGADRCGHLQPQRCGVFRLHAQ